MKPIYFILMLIFVSALTSCQKEELCDLWVFSSKTCGELDENQDTIYFVANRHVLYTYTKETCEQKAAMFKADRLNQVFFEEGKKVFLKNLIYCSCKH